MAHYSRRSLLLRQLCMLLIVPTLLIGVGYAAFSQDLSLATTTSNISYTSANQIAASYTKTETLQGNKYSYSFSPFTVVNRGTTTTETWRVLFDGPADMTSLSCAGSVTCAIVAGTTVRVSNTASNGALASGASATFTFSFTSTSPGFTLDNVQTAATFPAVFQNISGLTVTISKGTKSGKTWSPVVITVKNNSGQPINGWQVTVTPWSSNYTVNTTMPSGIIYTTTASQLIFTSTNPLANGATATINTSATTANTWNVAATVQGQL